MRCVLRVLVLAPLLLASCAHVAAYRAPPPYPCHRIATADVTLDGRLDEPVWAHLPAIMLGRLKDGARPAVSSVVRFAWTDEALYVGAVLEDADLLATITEHDGRLWEDDCFEFYVNPVPGQVLPYVEFEVNARGAWYDSLVLDLRKTLSPRYEQPWKHNFEPPGVAVTVAPLTGAVKGWAVEMRVPLSAFVLTQDVPAKEGQVWRVAVFRVNQRGGGLPAEEYAWRPVASGRFHAPEAFAPVVLAGALPAMP